MTIPLRYRAAARSIGTALDVLAPRIAAVQAAYIDAHGRYLQLLPTHATIPVEGTPTPADQLTRAPHDRRTRTRVPAGVDADGQPRTRVEVAEDDTWTDTRLTPPTALSVEVHDYDGPAGKGYVVVVRMQVGNATVSVEVPVGPERYRSRAVSVTREGAGT